jgi:hypothetical protein
MRPATGWRVVGLPQAGAGTYAELVLPAPSSDVVLRLGRSQPLVGRLLGEDVDGFEVLWTLPPGPEGARVGTAAVRADGGFRIEGLPAATVRLYARRIGDDRYALAESVPGPTPVELTLLRGAAIEGTCDESCRRVIARQGDLHQEGRASAGKFRIGGVAPGRWTLRSVLGTELQFESRSSVDAEPGASGVRLP